MVGAMQSENLVVKVRREIELVETRLQAQISRLQETTQMKLDKSYRAQEACNQRLEQRIFTHESSLAKAERKLSEIGGMHKGLTDEVHAQLRRVDAGDSRIWDFRRQVEEQCRSLCEEVHEKNRVALSTKSREIVDVHEGATRKTGLHLRRLETLVEERAKDHRDVLERSLEEMMTRLEAIEESIHQEESHRTHMIEMMGGEGGRDDEVRPGGNDPDMRRQLIQLSQTCESLKADTHGEQGICSRLEEHDVRLTALRSKVDSQEKHYREGTAESFYKAFRQIQDHENTIISHGTRLEELEACWAQRMDDGSWGGNRAGEHRQSLSDDGEGADSRATSPPQAELDRYGQLGAYRQAPAPQQEEGMDWNHATSRALLDAYSRFSSTPVAPLAPVVIAPVAPGSNPMSTNGTSRGASEHPHDTF
jgi:hypothetical protein